MNAILRTTMLLAALTALFGFIGMMIGGATGLVLALAFAVAINFFSYWNADSIVLRIYKAQIIDPARAQGKLRRYAETVSALAERAGLPQPKICIIDNPQPNAFATGRNPENAAVAATTGLLERLSDEEIAGVMAHELAHVKNRDTLIMTMTATIAGAITALANFALFFGGNRDNGGLIGALAIMLLAPLAAGIVQMAISRTREYEADRIGAEICGQPLWLASALARISSASEQIVNPVAERHPETGQLMIINPLAGRGADNLFSTHPATQNRIERLQQMAGAMVAYPPRQTSRGPWG